MPKKLLATTTNSKLVEMRRIAFVTLVVMTTLCLAVLPCSKASYPFTSEINILEPQNIEYQKGTNLSIAVNFTAWYNFDINYFVTYSLDGDNSSVLEYQISANDSWDPYIAQIQGSVALPQLGEGIHNITVLAQASYWDSPSGSRILHTNSSNSVTFTIKAQSTPMPTSTPSNQIIPNASILSTIVQIHSLHNPHSCYCYSFVGLL